MITMHRPLRVKEQSYPGTSSVGWAVDGSPCDCVKLAIEALLPVQPVLLISGINQGPNLGTDVLYSGTVAAAIEGSTCGVPSIAISLATYKSSDFSYSADFIRRLVALYGDKLPSDTLLNINVPEGAPKGVKITRLANRQYHGVFSKRTDPRGRTYYWMAGEPKDLDGNDPQTDVWAVNNGYISISPIQYDLTCFPKIQSFDLLFQDFFR
jgi:5'-nucleotidase